MEKKNKFLIALKNSHIVIVLIAIFALAGCSNDTKTNELEGCNSDICGYWKLFATENYSGTEDVEYTNEEGFEYLKVTSNEFEKVKYKENSIYNYENSTYTYENKIIKAENTEYTVEFIEDKLVLNYKLNNNPTKVFYEKVESNEYPKVNMENGSKKIYNSTNLSGSCEGIECGYWKLSEVMETCDGETNKKVEGEKVLLSNYLKFDESNIEWVNYINDKKVNIQRDFYHLKHMEEEVYNLYFNSSPIETHLIGQSDYRVNVYVGSIKNNTLSLNVIYFAPENDAICSQTHTYQKITEAEFPNINIYMD